MDLDLKDRKIMYALEQNARETNVALARLVNLAPDVVQYRIDRLIDRGIIKFFLGYINFAKLGYVDYGLHLSTQRMNRAQEKAFVDFFHKHSYCPYFCRSGGSYDYVADILARDPLSLTELITEISNKFGEFIYRQEIVTRIHATHFPKQYLLDATPVPLPVTYFGGSTAKRESIDETDDQILRIIAADAKVRWTEIAKEIGISNTAISQRIKRMEAVQLITGYFAWSEPQSFGYQSVNLFLKVQNLRPADEQELFEFCKAHRHITWFIKTLGQWDFEINVEVKGQEDLQEVVFELKDHFAAVIQRIEFAPIFHTIKYTQYPFSHEAHVW